MKTCLNRIANVWSSLKTLNSILVLFLLVCVSGCGGSDSETDAESDPAVATSENGSGNPLTAPVDYLGAVNQAQKSSANKLSLMGIQQAIQQFKIMEERLPKNLAEVVSSGYISRLPEAPRGSSIVYDPKTGLVSTVAVAPVRTGN